MAHNLRPLPPLPSSARPRSVRVCLCGCSGTTTREFVPGHDARAKGWVVRIVRGVCGWDAMSEGEQAGIASLMSDAARMARWGLTAEVAAWVAAQDVAEVASEEVA